MDQGRPQILWEENCRFSLDEDDAVQHWNSVCSKNMPKSGSPHEDVRSLKENFSSAPPLVLRGGAPDGSNRKANSTFQRCIYFGMLKMSRSL
jgi:hypothetical protein